MRELLDRLGHRSAFAFLAVLLAAAALVAPRPALAQGPPEWLWQMPGHTDDVTSVAFSPDGRTVASGSRDNTVRLWDARTGALIRALTGRTGRVESVAFSPDGRTLASGSEDRTVRLWDAQTGALLRTLTGHRDDVLSVAFSPDGRTLASGSWDRTVRLWDAQTGALLRTLSGHTNYVESVAFSPDGRTLASGSWDRTVRLWDAQTGALLRTLTGHTSEVRSVAFSPDGRTLASGSGDRTVRLWDAQTGALIRALTGHTGWVESVAFSPDGRTLASGSSDRTVRVWDAQTGALLRTLTGHTDWVYSVAFSPDGRTLASGSGDRTVRLWDAQTGALLRTLTGHTDWVYSVAFSPDGRTLASGSRDRTVRLWDAQTGALIRALTGHTSGVHSVAYSPDGRTLASGSFDNTVRLWDAQTGVVLRTFTGHGITSVAFSPDGRTLASGSGDNTVRLWDAQTGALLRTLTGHTDYVYSVAFSPDGRTLASGSRDRTVRLWDAQTGALLRTLTGHTDYVYSVAFSPDGRTLASGSRDRTVRLWDAQTGALLRTLTGHTSEVRSVAFSPDGRTLASGSFDNTVRLWESQTGALLNRYDEQISFTFSVAFSPDGSLLGIGGFVSGVAINPFPPELGLDLRAVSPRLVAPRAGVRLRYVGTGFEPGLRLRLEGNGFAVEGTAVNRLSPFVAEGTFDLTGFPFGLYTAIVIQGTEERRLPAAIEVIDPNRTTLTGKIIAPARMRAGRTANVQIVVNRDFVIQGGSKASPLLLLESDQPDVLFRTDPGKPWTRSLFLVGGKPGSAGQLNGGESFRFNLEMKSPNRDVRSKLKLSAVPAFKAELFANGWAGAKAALRPEWIDPDVWDQMWPGFAAQLGTNSDEFLNNLRDSAAWLEGKDAPSRELGDVLGVAFRKAKGRVAPIPLLASATDLHVVAPEVDLSVTRYAPASIEGRGKRGPLGRGWALNYDWKFEDGSNASKVLVLPDGRSRHFAPTRQGEWAEVAGGAAKLGYVNSVLTMTEVDGTTYQFSETGRLSSIRGRFGSTVTVERSQGRIDRVLHSNGASIDFSYDLQGRLRQVTDSTGRSVSYSYGSGDQSEYLTGVTLPGGRTYRMQNIPAGNGANSHALSRIEAPDGTQQLFEYEAGMIKRLSLAGNSMPITFDYASGRGHVEIVDGTGGRTSMAVGRGSLPLTTETVGAGSSKLRYSELGDVKRVETARGAWTGTHDNRGNLVESRDRRGILRGKNHSLNFNGLRWARDGRNNTHTQVLDSKDLPTEFVFPDGSRERLAYNALGQVIERVNRRGQRIAYAYNDSGQPVTVTMPDRVIRYTYDARQRVTQIDCSRTGWVRYGYDDRDYLRRIDYEGGAWVRYELDDAGKRTRMESSDGQIVQYTYYSTGFLRDVRFGHGPGELLAEFVYDDAGRVVEERRGNGTRVVCRYTVAGYLERIQHYLRQTLQAEYRYTHDESGLPLTADTPEGRWTYKYDAEHQLTEYTMPGGTRVVIEYDAEGNRIRRVVNGVLTNYVTNVLNQYTSVGGLQPQYDADGNLTRSFDENNQPVTMAYDALGRLVRSEGARGVTTYEYDAVGNLTKITDNGVTRKFLFDGKRAIAEFDGSNQLSRRYWYANGLLGQQSNDQAQFFGYDMTGHTRLVTAADGTVLGQASYDPFGAVVASQGQVETDFLFCGRLGQRTLPSGGVLMGSRVYNSALGRFQQIDPIRLASDSLNLYRYGANSPVSYVDPTGHIAVPVVLAVIQGGLLVYDGVSSYLDARQQGASVGVASLQSVWNLLTDYALGAVVPGVPILRRYANNILAWTYRKTLPRNFVAYFQRMKLIQGLTEILDDYVLGELLGRLGLFEATELGNDELFQEILRQQDPDGGDPDNGGDLDEKETEVGTSYDPNEKAGAKGVGPEGWVTPDEEFVYTVYFENLPTARAHAQEVFVTDVLDANLDLSTMELREVNISGETYADLTGYQEGTFRVPFKDTGLVAEVTATFDIGSRTLRWTMRSLDPLTNELPDGIDQGLLPPNDSTGRGEGYVRFVIRPRRAVSDGTVVRNQARIVFDDNPHIDTNVWTNTLDVRAPVSRVQPHTGLLPSMTSALVEWSGSDGSGSGIATFDIYVREGNGAWRLWLDDTNKQSAVFIGERGKTYQFFSIAKDRVGREEPQKGEAETTVRMAG